MPQSRKADPSVVYHYTSAQTALEHILTGESLRLGPVGDTNDPGDVPAPPGAWMDYEPGAAGEQRALDALTAVSGVVHGQHKVACFTQDDLDAGTDYLPDGSSKLGWARDRMWAQYADGHRGVCLCFDREALITEAKRLETGHLKVEVGSVKYADDLHEPMADLGSPDDPPAVVGVRHLFTHLEYLYFTKRLDWQGEAEFRILLVDSKPGGPYAFLNVAKALRSIYVGHRFSRAYRPSIQQVCARLGVPAYQYRLLGKEASREDYASP